MSAGLPEGEAQHQEQPPVAELSTMVNEELMTLRAMLPKRDAEISLLKQTLIPKPGRLTPEVLQQSEISDYFKYSIRFSYWQFNSLCTLFQVPSTSTSQHTEIPFVFKRKD